MTRANKHDTQVRAVLESIAVELATIRVLMPVTRLRVLQARERTGQAGLLSPALEDLTAMVRSVDEIGKQVTSALDELLE